MIYIDDLSGKEFSGYDKKKLLTIRAMCSRGSSVEEIQKEVGYTKDIIIKYIIWLGYKPKEVAECQV